MLTAGYFENSLRQLRLEALCDIKRPFAQPLFYNLFFPREADVIPFTLAIFLEAEFMVPVGGSEFLYWIFHLANHSTTLGFSSFEIGEWN